MSNTPGIFPDPQPSEGKPMIGKRLNRWWGGPHQMLSSLNRVVAGAHPSVIEIGEKRRAQLSAWIAMLLAFLYLTGVVSSAFTRGQIDTNVWVLVVLTGISLAAYIVSRTRYYSWGGWLITGSTIIVGYAFVLLGLGTNTSLDSFIPLSFVLGSILLMPAPLVFWVLVGIAGMFFVPSRFNLDVGTLSGIYLSMGSLLLVSVIFRNSVERQRLTELRKVNAELHKANLNVESSSQRTRIVFQTLSEGVGVTDPAGILVEVNENLLRLAGYERQEDLLGRNVSFLVSDPERPRVLQNFSFGVDLGKPLEYRMVSQDGRAYDGEMTVSLLQNEQGERSGFVTVVRDITLQKQAAEAIRMSEARQRQILDTIPASILITRLPDGNLLYANQTMIDEFGLLPEQLAGKTTPDLYYDLDDRARLLATLRDQGSLNNFVARAKRQDNGQPFWGDLSGRMIDFAGERALISTIIDITARRQAEENLQARDEALHKFSITIADLSRSGNIISGNLKAAVDEIDEAVSHTLNVKRVSTWFYSEDRNQIQCADLFEPGKGHITSGNLSASDFPGYFAALQNGKTIVADDALAHPSTREFSQVFLTLLGINSMLVVPIRLRGQITGVLSCEHIGPKRHWTLEEESFLTSIVDFVSNALEAQERVRLAREIEESFERRGLQVQLSTQIAQEISTSSGLNELFHRVVTLVKERFGYYHTQLFRYDPTQNAVVLITGYGEIGVEMLQAHHRLPMGTGLIGTAAATGETVLRSEVMNDPDWRSNPLLPETKGEIAVPIKLRGQVLGVLDVQSNQVGALTQDDQILLEGLCGQVAVAIEETRLRQEMADRLQELNALYASMSHQGWDSMQGKFQTTGYLYDQVSVVPVVADKQQLADETTGLRNNFAYTAVPMQVHGSEYIGEVSVENDPTRPLTDEELAFVEQVAEQVSLALESARLFAQTQATLGETEDLYQASAELNAATTYDEILNAVRKSVDKEEEAHIVTIGLFDHPWTETSPAQSVNMLATWSSLPEQAVAHFPKHFKVSESPLTMALKPNSPAVIEDAKTDPNLDEAIRSMLLHALVTQSAINAPLTVSGQWIGFMSVSFPHPRKFSEDEIRRLMALSSQAAIAINNLLLLETTRVRAQRERILREVTTRVRASVDADTILRTAVRELGSALGREAFIRLISPEQTPDKVDPLSHAVEGGK